MDQLQVVDNSPSCYTTISTLNSNPKMDYDYSFYRQVITALWNAAWRDPANLEIGEDITDIPAVKIIFDGYGYNEETDEQDNVNMESYALFIHRRSGEPDFEFPPHDLTPWALIHRPREEVCIYLWYDVENEELSIQDLDETSDSDLTVVEIMAILQTLWDTWFDYPEAA